MTLGEDVPVWPLKHTDELPHIGVLVSPVDAGADALLLATSWKRGETEGSQRQEEGRKGTLTQAFHGVAPGRVYEERRDCSLGDVLPGPARRAISSAACLHRSSRGDSHDPSRWRMISGRANNGGSLRTQGVEFRSRMGLSSVSRMASTSMVMRTSLPTTIPAFSSELFQLTPKSWRLIVVLPVKPTRVTRASL